MDHSNRLAALQQQKPLSKTELRNELELALQEVDRLYQENTRLQREVEESGIDPLTGLEESRKHIGEIDKIIYSHRPVSMRGREEKAAVCLMMVDIDKFKTINDTYGHHVGDHVLKEAGNYLKSKVRNRLDRVQRISGDEFLLVFSGVTAVEIINRFRDPKDPEKRPRLSFMVMLDVREGASEEFKSLELKVVLSGGLVDCDVMLDPDASRVEAMERADKAMYRSKKTGKVELWDEDG